jgi:uncharacterized membrane protein (UPF0127 family)
MKRWIPILVLFGIMIMSCKEEQGSSDAPGPPPAYQFKKEGVLAFYTASGEKIKVIDIEVAATDEERAQGLMNRPWMEETQGMLFLFEDEKRQSFWMRNTIIPLDIMFVSSDMRIVNIARNTQPMSDRGIPSTGPAKYVVEVVAGFSDKYGLSSGDSIYFELM